MLLLLALVATGIAATWQVALDGNGDFTTLSDALDAAAAGDTIELAPGTYTPATGEHLPYYFPTEIRIEGAGYETTTLDAEGEESFGNAYNEDVVVSGITFTGATGYALTGRTGFTVASCRFRANSIALGLGNGAAVMDSQFEDNGTLANSVPAISG